MFEEIFVGKMDKCENYTNKNCLFNTENADLVKSWYGKN